jgi:hypothetical protein
MEREELKQKLVDLYNCGISESVESSNQIDEEILAEFDKLHAEKSAIRGIASHLAKADALAEKAGAVKAALYQATSPNVKGMSLETCAAHYRELKDALVAYRKGEPDDGKCPDCGLKHR